MFGVSGRPINELRKHEIIFFVDFHAAGNRLPARGVAMKKRRRFRIRLPRARHGQFALMRGLKCLFQRGFLKQIAPILQIMPVAVNRHLIISVPPFRDVFVMLKHVLKLGRLNHGFRERG